MEVASKLIVVGGAVLLAIVGGLAEGVNAAEAPRRYTEGCGLSEPRLLEKVAPEYPEQARSERIQGTVILDAVVRDDGTVGDVEVVESAHALLDAAANTAVRAWRYDPARDAEGRPVTVILRVTVRFRLS